jgi:hypothetical protein
MGKSSIRKSVRERIKRERRDQNTRNWITNEGQRLALRWPGIPAPKLPERELVPGGVPDDET